VAIKRGLDAAALGFAEAGRIEAERYQVLRGTPAHRKGVEATLARIAAFRTGASAESTGEATT
jgi:hypothetical protein